MSVTITTDTTTTRLSAPYNPALAPRAKAIGGQWEPAAKTWRFDARDEARVRDLARDIYGTDGSGAGQDDLVTVRVPARPVGDHHEDAGRVVLGGRIIAWRPSRDEPVRLADGVVIASGRFAGSAGSARYPAIGAGDVVLEVRDIPREVALATGAQIVDETADRRVTLTAERDRLLARLAQIDADLAGLA